MKDYGIEYRDGVAGKLCVDCGEWKPLTEFYSYKNGTPYRRCKKCYCLNSYKNCGKRSAKVYAEREKELELAKLEGTSDKWISVDCTVLEADGVTPHRNSNGAIVVRPTRFLKCCKTCANYNPKNGKCLLLGNEIRNTLLLNCPDEEHPHRDKYEMHQCFTGFAVLDPFTAKTSIHGYGMSASQSRCLINHPKIIKKLNDRALYWDVESVGSLEAVYIDNFREIPRKL